MHRLISVLVYSLFFLLVVGGVNSSIADQAEGTIAVNPRNPKNIVGAFINGLGPYSIACRFSTDGGVNWAGTDNISGSQSAGDPVVAFDPDGNGYLLYQIRIDQPNNTAGLYLHRSTNGGVDWSSRVIVVEYTLGVVDVDRPWMAISPNRNASGFFDIVVSYTRGDEGGQSVSLRKSTDGGATFGDFSFAAYDAGGGGGFTGSYVAFGKESDFALASAYYDGSSHNAVTSISVSHRTAGSTYSSTFSVNQIGELAGSEYRVKNGFIRADSYPRVGVDTISGNVYVVWAGKQTPSSSTKGDILLRKGYRITGGFQWETSNRIVVQGSGDQWMPTVHVTPDGVLVVVYYTTGDDPNDLVGVGLAYSTNGGSSFVQGTGGTSFSVTLPTFLGDYQGATSTFSQSTPENIILSYFSVGNQHPQIEFHTSAIPTISQNGYAITAVDQRDESSSSFGNIGRWRQDRFTEYVVPNKFLFKREDQGLRALQDFKPSTTQKYNRWDGYADRKNHKVFGIESNQPPIRAFFNSAVGDVTIKNELFDAPGITGGNVQFHDPWYIDFQDVSYGNNWRNRGMVEPRQFYTRSVGTGGFTPDLTTVYSEGPYPYRGVFLNQSFASGTYYSVGAPNPNTINGFTSYFVNWTGSNVQYQNASAAQTGVVFTNSGATATAKYKGHLISSVAAASGPTSQRKVVNTYTAASGNITHAVYESGGSIWYTRNTGSGWSNEIAISISSTAKNPSIGYSTTSGTYLEVVWTDVNPSNPSQWLTYYKKSTSLGLAWDPTPLLLAGAANEPSNPIVCFSAVTATKR